MTNPTKQTTIQTERLRLEPFAQSHAATLNAINNEPQVMEYLSHGDIEPIEDTRAAIARVQERWARLGFSWWAIIELSTRNVIGAACLQHVANDPNAELEIGWRLTKSANGKGYATEAGKAAATYAFDVVGAGHIVSVADQRNVASHRVMERVGMQFRNIETHYDKQCATYMMHRSDQGR